MTTVLNAITPSFVFLREWARNPLEVAAISPSSIGLARLITSQISSATTPVLEIGPGTGAFTAQLLANGVAPHDLTLLEKNAAFAKALQQQFPAVRVVNADAAEVDLRELNHGRPYRAVISGLGLLSMERRIVARLLRRVFQNMPSEGALYQFTYGLRCPVQNRLMLALGLEAQNLGRVWWNCPPAVVYRITRTADQFPDFAASWRF